MLILPHHPPRLVKRTLLLGTAVAWLLVWLPAQAALAYDCRFSERLRAVGVTFEVSPDTADTTYRYGLLDPAETATVARPALASGGGLVTPVPPGVVAVKASFGGAVVALVNAPVRQGTTTTVILIPQ